MEVNKEDVLMELQEHLDALTYAVRDMRQTIMEIDGIKREIEGMVEALKAKE